MPPKKVEQHGYEFFGPPGAIVISIGLPAVCYAFAFLCNDVSGCPAPSLLHPSTFTIDQLKKEIGWKGWSTVFSWEAFFANLGWYFLSLVLYRVLPATEATGIALASSGKPLQYRLNAFYSAVAIAGFLTAGTALFGAEWGVWTFIYDQYIPLLTSNIIIAYTLATYVYISSFSVKAGNKENRELAAGGHSGNIIYDWFIGRELNPRINIPIFGEVDIKAFMEIRPGLLGWIILDCTFVAAQWRHYGYVTDSIILSTVSQSIYVFDALYMEPAILTTIDIIADGFGFMLAFGDIAWLPFTYSLQTHYLAVYPLQLGPYIAIPIGAMVAGYAIFRGANNEKNRFRTNPDDPAVKHLEYIQTKSGSKLIVSGWWGRARHINYLGDWLLSWAYCLPTGVAGYQIFRGAQALAAGYPEGAVVPAGAHSMKTTVGSHGLLGSREWTIVAPSEAMGWGMIVTYFYMLYFAVLLIHRERRDEEKCKRKYGKDWDEYCKRVPSRIIPGIY